MRTLKRISMSGADIAVTDDTVADLVLEYAMHLGRAGTTDIVSVPVPDGDRQPEVDLLLGPASQIVLSESDGTALDPSRTDAVVDDLRGRIQRLTGRGRAEIADDEEIDPMDAFVDFERTGNPSE